MKKPKCLKCNNPCQQRETTADCQEKVTISLWLNKQKMSLLKYVFLLYIYKFEQSWHPFLEER